jgi:hypothetical protein
VFDMNDKHMRIGGADVILYRQASADTRRCGGEARMAESQRSCSVEPPHEGRNPVAIVRIEVVNMRAVDHFDGRLRRNAV